MSCCPPRWLREFGSELSTTWSPMDARVDLEAAGRGAWITRRGENPPAVVHFLATIAYK